jgi:general stress protein CsbA
MGVRSRLIRGFRMWFIIALIVPCLLVLLFTRVTYNHYIGTLLTVALLVASYFRGYTDELHEILADIVSTTVGFLYAGKMVKQLKE